MLPINQGTCDVIDAPANKVKKPFHVRTTLWVANLSCHVCPLKTSGSVSPECSHSSSGPWRNAQGPSQASVQWVLQAIETFQVSLGTFTGQAPWQNMSRAQNQKYNKLQGSVALSAYILV